MLDNMCIQIYMYFPIAIHLHVPVHVDVLSASTSSLTSHADPYTLSA